MQTCAADVVYKLADDAPHARDGDGPAIAGLVGRFALLGHAKIYKIGVEADCAWLGLTAIRHVPVS